MIPPKKENFLWHSGGKLVIFFRTYNPCVAEERRWKMDDLVPNKIFFTKGVGTHRDELHSFERALRDAGIEKCNLVQVSSIFPPRCKITSKAQGLKELIPGAITYCVMSRCCTNEP